MTFDTKTNLPLSTKGKDTALHGIGLSNVNVKQINTWEMWILGQGKTNLA